MCIPQSEALEIFEEAASSVGSRLHHFRFHQNNLDLVLENSLEVLE